MMQIVIDIPEKEYQNYLKMRPAYPDGVFCYIKAIQNGTPLQKDLDSSEVIPCKECKWHGYLTCSNPNGLKGWVTGNDFCSYIERRETNVI